MKTVAEEVYAEELREGSGVLDIGLFGGRLFNSDVVRELKEADGVLWEIRREMGSPMTRSYPVAGHKLASYASDIIPSAVSQHIFFGSKDSPGNASSIP